MLQVLLSLLASVFYEKHMMKRYAVVEFMDDCSVEVASVRRNRALRKVTRAEVETVVSSGCGTRWTEAVVAV